MPRPFQRWLKTFKKTPRNHEKHSPFRTRLAVETLEDRLTPSVTAVDNGSELTITTDSGSTGQVGDALKLSAAGGVLTLSSTTGLVNGNASVGGVSTATFNLADFSSIVVSSSNATNLRFRGVEIAGSSAFAGEFLSVLANSIDLTTGPLSVNGLSLTTAVLGATIAINQTVNSTGDVNLVPLGASIEIRSPINAAGQKVNLLAGSLVSAGFTINQNSTAAITAGELYAVAAGGVGLSSSANFAGVVAGRTTGGNFDFANGTGLRVGTVEGIVGVVATNGDVTLSVAAGKSIATDQGVTAGGTGHVLTLAADSFDLAAASPLIGENVVLNTVGANVGITLGNAGLTDAELNAITATNLTIQASGSLGIASAIALGDNVTNLITLIGGAIDVNSKLSGNASTGIIRLETDSLNLNTGVTQLVSAPQIEIVTSMNVVFTSAAVVGGMDYSQADLNSLDETAVGTLRFVTPGNITFANGSIGFNNGNVMKTGGVVALKSGGTISQVAGAAVGAANLAAVAGAVTLAEDGNSIQSVAGSASTGDFQLRSSTALLIDAVDVGVRGVGSTGITVSAGGNRLDLQSGGNVSQSAAGKVTASALAVSADGKIDLSTAINSVSTLAMATKSNLGSFFTNDSGGTLTIGAVGAISGLTSSSASTVFGIRNAKDLVVGQAIQLAGGGRLLQVGLKSDGGNVSQTSTGKIESGALTVLAGNNISLDVASNNVAGVGFHTDAAGAIKFQNDSASLAIGSGSINNIGTATGITSNSTVSTVRVANTGDVSIGFAIQKSGGGRLGAVALTSENGTVVAPMAGPGKIEADSLSVQAQSDITLDTVENNVLTLALDNDAAGTMKFKNNSGTTLAIGTAGSLTGITSDSSASTVSIVSRDAIALDASIQTAAAGVLGSVSITSTVGGIQQQAGVSLRGTALALSAGANIALAGRTEIGLGDATVTAGGTFTISGTLGITLASASSYSDVVASTTPIILAGASLELAGSYVPNANEVFTPLSGASRTGTFNGYANDSALLFNGKTLRLNYTATSVTLTAVGVPTANIQTKAVGENGADFAISLSASDPNIPALDLTYTITQTPAHGTLSGTAPYLTYTPTAGYSGPDNFQFKVNNGYLDSSDATVSIIVTPAPAIGDLDVTRWSTGVPGFTGSLAITGGTPNYAITAQNGLPTGLTVVLNGAGNAIVFTGTLTAGGTFNGSVTIADANGAIAVKTFTIQINAAPTDIRISNNTLLPNAGANALVGVLSTIDPDANDTFTYSLVTGSGDTDNGLFSIQGQSLRTNANLNYTNVPGFTVRIRSTDQGGLYTEKVITIGNPGSVPHGSTPTTIDLNAAPTDGNALGYIVTLTDPLLAINRQYGLDGGPLYVNAWGYGEKYLTTVPGKSPHNLLVLLPNGELRLYDGGTTAGGALIATLSRSVYDNPDILTKTNGAPLVSVANPLYDFKVKYGLDTPAGYFNATGRKEYYLHSSNFSNPAGSNDYILTSANTLIARGSNTLVADFTALGLGNVYANPALLTTAALGTQVGVTTFATPTPGSDPGGTVTITPLPAFDRSVVVTVQSIGIPTYNRTFTYTVLDATPVIAPLPDLVGSHSAPLAVPLSVSDPDPDSATRTYSVEITNPLFDLRQQYGFNTAANAADPTRGSAKFLYSAKGYYSILPDNKLYKDNGTNPPTLVLDLAAYGNVYANPALLTNAEQQPASVNLNRGQLYDLKAKYGLDTAPAYFNARGGNELYFKSSNGSNGGGYSFMIKPDGKLYAFDGSSTPTGTVVADVGTDVYFNPALLTQAQPTRIGDALYALKVKYGFDKADAYYDPAKGINEKYLYDTYNTNGGGYSYFLKADGWLYARGSQNGVGTQVAFVGTAVFDNPGLLYNATGQAAAVTGTVTNDILSLMPNAAFTGTVRVTVRVSDGAQGSTQSFLYCVVNDAPSVVPIGDRTIVSNGAAGATQVDLAAAFSDADPLTYAVSVADWLVDAKTKFGLNTVAGAIQPTRENARFLRSSNGSNVGGSNYFLIKPVAGKYPLLASDGTSSGGTVILEDVGIAVYNNPALLTAATTSPALANVTTTLAGSTLTIAWPAGYTGKFRVYVAGYDGNTEAGQSFFVSVL